jgi:hypothetical protein
VPCIGCRKCVKAAAEGQMLIDGFLARVNYANPPPRDLIDKAECPTGCLKSATDTLRKESACHVSDHQ